MLQDKKPIFHALAMLPTILEVVRGMLESSEEHLRVMEKTIDKPSVLDDKLIERSLALCDTQEANIELFIEQCARWRKDNPSNSQLVEIEKIEDNSKKLKNITIKIRSIIDNCEDLTLDKILAKDDLEVAMEFLTGKLKFPS